ncbi:hypothetical protein ALO90_200072 [Pseudomonas amygdali pv. aesculi]|nr:hypothetical protein ALO90_200072 [Pseudomonas amygdali pv. aesculi]
MQCADPGEVIEGLEVTPCACVPACIDPVRIGDAYSREAVEIVGGVAFVIGNIERARAWNSAIHVDRTCLAVVSELPRRFESA